MSEQPHFPLQKLGEVVEVLDHLRIPVNAEAREKRKGDVPYYGANGLQGWIDEPLFNEPLILMAEDGGNFDDFSTRPIAYRIDGPAWINNHAHIIKADNPKLHSFIYWSVAHKDIRKHVVGGTRQKLNQSALKEIEIPCPPNDEGAVVGKVLDTLDTQIEKTEALIAKLEKVKEGLLHDLLTRGINENGQLRPSPEQAPELYKESPLGLIPREWKIHPFGDTVERVFDFRGRTPKKLGMTWGGGDVLALSANNVQPGGIDISREAYLGSEQLYQKWMTKGDVKKGDVLLTMEAPLGNIAQISDDEKYIMSQRVIALRYFPATILNNFAYWVMQSVEFQQAMKERSTGSTATGIQRAELFKLNLKSPPLDEQELIARRIFSLDSQLRREVVLLEKLEKEKLGLMDDLLTGRIRVTPLLEKDQATTPA